MAGIVGRISPTTWAAIQTFLNSIGTGEYKAMALALTQMGATDTVVDQESFARDLEKLFESIQVILWEQGAFWTFKFWFTQFPL